MNIVIRKAEQKDMDALFPMWKEQTILHYHFDPGYYVALAPDEQEQFEKYFTEALASHNPHFLVAEVEGQVVGFTSFKRSKATNYDSHIKEYGYILELFVKEDYRKQGIGQKLVEEVENYFRSEGINYMKLEAADHNETAISFYEDHGYKTAIRMMYKKIGGDA